MDGWAVLIRLQPLYEPDAFPIDQRTDVHEAGRPECGRRPIGVGMRRLFLSSPRQKAAQPDRGSDFHGDDTAAGAKYAMAFAQPSCPDVLVRCGDRVRGVVHHDGVKRRVGKRQLAARDHVYIRHGASVANRSLHALRALVVPDDDFRRSGQAAFRGDQRDGASIRVADLERSFAQANAAHRHCQRIPLEARFAQKHAHFLMI